MKRAICGRAMASREVASALLLQRFQSLSFSFKLTALIMEITHAMLPTYVGTLALSAQGGSAKLILVEAPESWLNCLEAPTALRIPVKALD
jgi:hypothetical protein